MNMLKVHPEFLNRIDETIMFLPLTEKDQADCTPANRKRVQKCLLAMV